jgi:hypothetical protein
MVEAVVPDGGAFSTCGAPQAAKAINIVRKRAVLVGNMEFSIG